MWGGAGVGECGREGSDVGLVRYHWRGACREPVRTGRSGRGGVRQRVWGQFECIATWRHSVWRSTWAGCRRSTS